MIHPVILCGGSGTRLWPLSRRDRPKPFLPLVGPHSLFEQTLDRCTSGQMFAPPVIVAGETHIELIEKQIGDRADVEIIVEPAARNTAPAIALAAMRLPADAVMLVCPSDHHIKDASAFVAAAEMAASLAHQHWLVAFGIKATHPETGYGYILQGEQIGGGFSVERFVEKPDLPDARRFLDEGGFSWNGGIFCFEAGIFLAELEKFHPQMIGHLRAAVTAGTADGLHFRPEAEEFAAIEGISVDYAVMEKTDKAAMVPVSMGWSDIGNWQALHDAREKDEAGNSVSGRTELVDCENTLIQTDGPRVSAIGIKDLIVVVDGDEVLITTAEGAQLVGKLGGAVSQ